MSRAPGKVRVVFDCNIFIQAMAFERGPAAGALRLAEAGGVELFVSRAVLAELKRVLNYEEVQAMSSNITPALIDAFLRRLSAHATVRRLVPRSFEFERDPKDEPYLDLAASVKADYLVTRDKDLLSLMTGHSKFCKEFRQKTRPLRVVDPVRFLKEVARQSLRDS